MTGVTRVARRHTLSQSTARYSGIGLHSGQPASVRFLPGAPGSGRVFIDLTSGQKIAALAANVSDTSRCAQLRCGAVTVQTVEHVLAALAGLGVDDAIIEFDGCELPAADGSAAPFAALILAAGVCAHGAAEQLRPITVTRPCFVEDGRGGSIVALPAKSFNATVVLDYPNHPYIGTQAFTFDGENGDFVREVAPARTYGFISELEALRTIGLALGASHENAIALGEDRYDSELRFPDELARHKLLDLIGDLALTGAPLCARLIAIKPGHALNTRMARLLVEREHSPAN